MVFKVITEGKCLRAMKSMEMNYSFQIYYYKSNKNFHNHNVSNRIQIPSKVLDIILKALHTHLAITNIGVSQSPRKKISGTLPATLGPLK